MPENKLQHYVPRCHLRPFTLGGMGAAVDLFHIDGRKIIRGAPAKNQCAKDYFYGDDLLLEKALQGPEGHYSNIIRTLESGGSASPNDLGFLVQFFVMQSLRTFGNIEKMLRASAQMNLVFGPDGPHGDQGYQQSWAEAVDLAIESALEVISRGQVSDLRVCIGKNHTDRPFITSDDPAVHLNRYYRQRLGHDGFGFINTGAMFFLPLTPSHMLIAFDDGCYQCEGRKGDVIDIHRRDDVDRLNQFQMLNARKALYLPPVANPALISDQFETLAPKRPNEWVRLTYLVEDKNRPGVYLPVPDMPKELGFMQHAEQVRPAPATWPRFLPFRNRILTHKTGTGAGDVRPAMGLDDLEWQQFARRAGL